MKKRETRKLFRLLENRIWLFTALAFSAALNVKAAPAPLALHPKNPHYFLFRGKPTVLITSAEHYGSVLNGGFDYKKNLATLAADGMNFTRIFGGSYVEVPATSFGIKRNTLAPPPGKFIAPWMRSEI